MSSAPSVAPALAAATVLTPDGRSARLDTLWEDGPAVVAWIRHYG